METSDIPNLAPNNWQPITNKHDLAVLGKLGEETCELGASLFRCIIQGIDEKEPVTGKINREWVEEEIADVKAQILLIQNRLNLNVARIAERAEKKYMYKSEWFRNLALSEVK